MKQPWDLAFAEKLAGLLVRRRRICLFLAGAIIVACCMGLRSIVIENDYRSFIGDDNRALQVSDWLNDRQGLGRESVVLLYSAADGDVFSAQSLLQYTFVAREARRLPLVADTQSLLDINKLVTAATPAVDGIQYREAPFTFGADIFSEAGRATLKRDALSLPTIRSRFIGSDGASAAILLSLELDPGRPRRSQIREFFAAVDELTVAVKQEVADDGIHLAGAALFDYSASTVLSADIRRAFPLALLLIAVSFYVMYRSAVFVPFAMLIVFLPVAATAGLSAVLGLTFSNLSISALLLVGTLAVAEVIHISNSFFKLLGDGVERMEALRLAIRNNLKAITATTIATMIGETALLFSAARPIQITGLVIILGSAVSLGLILLMLPSLLAVTKPRETHMLSTLSERIADISLLGYHHAKKVLTVAAGLLIVCIVCIVNANLADSLTGWFKDDTDYHRAMQLMDERYFSADTLTIAIEARNEDLVAARAPTSSSEPIELYRRLDERLRAQGGAGDWLNPVNTAEVTRRLLSDTAATSLRIDDPDTFAMLKAFSTESVGLSGLITRFQPGKRDYSLWFFDSDEGSSFELVESAKHFDNVLKAHVDGREVQIGGIGLALAQLSIDNFWNIFYGSVLTLILISLLMFAIQWSWRLGIVALLPNIAPLLIAFGIWGFWHGYYNLATITVFSVALGIVVDDTLHLLLKYQLKKHYAPNPESALRAAISECGVGVLITTVIVGGGFVLIGTSGFLLTAQKGQLAAIAVFAAFLFDIFVLPALISVAQSRSKVMV